MNDEKLTPYIKNGFSKAEAELRIAEQMPVDNITQKKQYYTKSQENMKNWKITRILDDVPSEVI